MRLTFQNVSLILTKRMTKVKLSNKKIFLTFLALLSLIFLIQFFIISSKNEEFFNKLSKSEFYEVSNKQFKKGFLSSVGSFEAKLGELNFVFQGQFSNHIFTSKNVKFAISVADKEEFKQLLYNLFFNRYSHDLNAFKFEFDEMILSGFANKSLFGTAEVQITLHDINLRDTQGGDYAEGYEIRGGKLSFTLDSNGKLINDKLRIALLDIVNDRLTFTLKEAAFGGDYQTPINIFNQNKVSYEKFKSNFTLAFKELRVFDMFNDIVLNGLESQTGVSAKDGVANVQNRLLLSGFDFKGLTEKFKLDEVGCDFELKNIALLTPLELLIKPDNVLFAKLLAAKPELNTTNFSFKNNGKTFFSTHHIAAWREAGANFAAKIKFDAKSEFKLSQISPSLTPFERLFVTKDGFEVMELTSQINSSEEKVTLNKQEMTPDEFWEMLEVEE